MSDEHSVRPYGDAALLVRFGELIDPDINRRAHALADRIRAARAAGVPWQPPVAAYASVLAPYDPLRMRPAEAESALRRMLEADLPAPGARARPPLEVHVRYGGDDGPDLAHVAQHTGLAPERVVELHASRTYRAYMLGFAPGFAYLGILPDELSLPRRATPRRRVAPGSVAIAGRQTAVYPLATPGGWHIIGRTDLRPWDATRARPALIEPGMDVQFVPR